MICQTFPKRLAAMFLLMMVIFDEEVQMPILDFHDGIADDGSSEEVLHEAIEARARRHVAVVDINLVIGYVRFDFVG